VQPASKQLIGRANDTGSTRQNGVIQNTP